MINIITRGETRKMKQHELRAVKCKDSLYKKSETDKQKKRQADQYQNEEYMNRDFERALIEYAAWPQPIHPKIKKSVIAEFRDKIDFSKLQELFCAICSRIYDCKNSKRISIIDIDLSILEVLNHLIDLLCEHLKVVFIGERTPTNYQLKKILQVRKSKVAAALQWLFVHNKLFKNDFILDKNALNLLPEGEIPESLTLITTVVNIDLQESEHYTGYSKETDSENDYEASDDNDPDLDNFIKNNTIESVSQVLYMLHGCKPFNEYEDETLLPAGFLVLFPYGVGGHEGQSFHVFLKKYADHLMRHHDPKFRQHSINDIKLAIEQEQNKLPIINSAINELLMNINVASYNLMASPQAYARMRNKIHAIILHYSSPSLFITINPADLHSPIVMMYAGNEIDLEGISSKNFSKATERARLTHLDPSAVTKYFDIIIRCVLDIIIGYGKEQDSVF
ncbi:17964_t:CDS:2, partial [Cetraspora pellucida]